MPDIAINRPTAKPRQRSSPGLMLLPALMLFGAVFMGAGVIPPSLRPLKVLQIAYPRWMDYAHILIPGVCAAVWAISLRRWPNVGGGVAVLLCFTLIPFVPRYAESRVAKVSVTRWIDSNDLKSIEDRLGVPLFEQGSADGTFVIAAPENERRVREELGRLQLLGEAAAE